MFGPESITDNSFLIADNLRSRRLGVPIEMCGFSLEAEWKYDALDKQIIDEVDDSIRRPDLAKVATLMFENNHALEETLVQVGKPLAPDKLRFWHIQSGRKAYILLWEASEGENTAHFVTYLSRGPNGSSAEKETREDFFNLRRLKRQRDDFLLAEHKPRFDVIKPLALANTLPYQGKKSNKYTFFTMPFAAGYAELHLDVVTEPVNIPYFRHAFSLTSEMEEASLEQFNKGPLSLLREMTEIVRQVHNHQDLLRIITSTEPYNRINRQRNDVLVALALIHQLLEGRFPKGFSVNSGDLMGRFDTEGRLSLLLTSLRGSLSQAFPMYTWIDMMQKHFEPIGNGRQLLQFAPDLQKADLEMVYDQARAMLKPV